MLKLPPALEERFLSASREIAADLHKALDDFSLQAERLMEQQLNVLAETLQGVPQDIREQSLDTQRMVFCNFLVNQLASRLALYVQVNQPREKDEPRQ